MFWCFGDAVSRTRISSIRPEEREAGRQVVAVQSITIPHTDINTNVLAGRSIYCSIGSHCPTLLALYSAAVMTITAMMSSQSGLQQESTGSSVWRKCSVIDTAASTKAQKCRQHLEGAEQREAETSRARGQQFAQCRRKTRSRPGPSFPRKAEPIGRPVPRMMAHWDL